MSIFRNQEDRNPVAIIVALFFADLSIYYLIDSIPLLCLWAGVVFWPKLFICSWNHHHQHCKTFHNTLFNRLLEVVYTFHTGVTTNVWILHHNLGHHLNYLDQQKDESRWQRRSGKTMGFLEYTFSTAFTGYFRGFKVGTKFPKYQRDFISMGLLNLALLIGLSIHKPYAALIVFLIPMLLSYIGTCATTYFHHAGLSTEEHHLASHNVLNDFYNLITGNLGYHTAHHMKPGLHWSKLPQYHQKIADKIPEELISYDFPGTALPKRLFLKLCDY